MRPRPPLFRALGRQEPPDTVEVAGAEWQLETVYKHDSWAATALYRRDGQRIVCKFNRVEPIFWLPARWIGRMLARREARFLDRLSDVALVPAGLGEVRAAGRALPNAVARAHVAGEPFRSDSQITPGFLDELDETIAAVHARDVAYVDLHKRENVIVGTDGRPYLVDFQVSFGPTPRWPGNGRIARFFLAELQEMDRYHLLKHRVRCFPGQQSRDGAAPTIEHPLLVRLHRRYVVPFRNLRRRLLVRLGIRDRTGMAQSEHEPEAAFREPAREPDAPRAARASGRPR